MIVIDASVLLAFLAPNDPHHQNSIDVLASDEALTIHTITLAESLVRGERDGRLDEVIARVAGLGIRELDRGHHEARELARLRVATGLKLPDCCVLLAAGSADGRLATFDRRLARAARDLGVEVLDGDL